jgi:hypothetical protein
MLQINQYFRKLRIFMRHFIGFSRYYTFVCFQNTLFPHSPASLPCPSSASLTGEWLVRTGDHDVSPDSVTFWLLRWSLQKEQFSLIFVKLPGWGIPFKDKSSDNWK